MFSGRDPGDLFPYSNKCDVYPFGLLAHEVIVAFSPWVDFVSHTTLGKEQNDPDKIILQVVKMLICFPITTPFNFD